MKKAVMKFTACCLAVGMAVTGSGTVALADCVVAGLGMADLTGTESTTEEVQGTVVPVDTAKTVTAAAGLSVDAAIPESDTETAGGTVVAGVTGETAAETTGETAAAETTGETAAAETTGETAAAETTGETAAAETTGETAAAETTGETVASESTEGTAASESTGETAASESTEGTAAETADETTAETEAVLDTSMSGELAFAQCEEYINVRSSADADSEVVGKVYNNGSVTILGQVGDWYQIQSGNATGYVKAEYFATGEAAEAVAEEVGYNVATVYPEALVIRAEASEDSEQIATAYASDQLEVVEYDGDWMKVALGDGVYGYVSAYYVSYDTYYSTAETLEEEQERLDEQWLAYLAEQKAEEEAAAAAAEAAAAEASYSDSSSSDSSYSDTAYTDSSYTETTDLSTAQAAADAAYQNYLDAQATADAATQGMDEQAVYDTAAAATAAYEEYLSAQNKVDALAAGQTVSTDTQQDTTSYTDTSYTDTTYTDTSYTATTYTDTSYTETTDLSTAQATADAAYQAYLDAQAAADAATQGADEQAVYDTAAAATAAYQEYLSAQNTVDALAAGQAVLADTYEDTSYQETYTEETTAQTEAVQTEAAQTEAAQTEAAQTEAASSTGQSIANYAVQFVGNPYVWGGTSLTDGADCSGFTQSVFANFGISIPRTAAEQASSGTAVDLSSIQAGDLIFYSDGSGISHVALYIGGGQVVHASTSSTGIIISSYNYRTPVCARRYC